MSTEYKLIKRKGLELRATERSSKIELDIVETARGNYISIVEGLTAEQVCQLAEKLIIIASYIAEDPEKILQRYNLDYDSRDRTLQL